MTRAPVRHDFLIKDLAISIGSGGRGGTWLPGPDGETPPSPISPIASIIAISPLIEGVRGTILEAVKAKRYDDIGRAFAVGDVGGNPAIRSAIHDIGAAVVASAAFAALGSAGMPNPECGGTSYETIPPTLTPIIRTGVDVHQVEALPRLRAQLAHAMAYVDKAAAAQAPQGGEVAAVKTQLEAALKALG